MNAATFSTLIVFMVLAPCGAAQDRLPGEVLPASPQPVEALDEPEAPREPEATFPAWAQPAKPTALRAAASVHVPGLMDIDSHQPLQVMGQRGVFSSVRVPQGFPVYLASEFMRIEEEKQLAWVTTRNLNARFVPSTIGNLPVGKVSSDDGALVLLGIEGAWARVIAPETLLLYVPTSDIVTAASSLDSLDAETVRAQYNRLAQTREARRQEAIAAWRAAHPEWKQEDAWLTELMEWRARDIDGLDATARATLDARLRELEPRVTWNESRQMIRTLRREAMTVDDATAAVERQRIQAEQAVDRVKLAERRVAESLAREAKLLDLGLAFDGKGKPDTLEGVVEVYEGAEAARVFVLRVTQTGEALKLTSARRAVDLSSLLGRRVKLAGRRLFLPSINGPMFVVESQG